MRIRCLLGFHRYVQKLPFMHGNPTLYDHYRECRHCGKAQTGGSLLGPWSRYDELDQAGEYDKYSEHL